MKIFVELARQLNFRWYDDYFNNDGFVDFATADYNSGTASILTNNTRRMSDFPEGCEGKERHCRSSDFF